MAERPAMTSPDPAPQVAPDASLTERLAALMGPPRTDDYRCSDDGLVAGNFPNGLKAAAVLAAFVDHPRPTLLLTRRTEHLSNHAGQVAFPGGRADPEDADSIATALREAQEEIGLTPTVPSVVGTAIPYLTGTGFEVTPVVAVIPPGLTLVPHEAEVATIFEVPVDIVFNPAYHQRKTIEWQGRMRSFYEISGSAEYIWGATAGMIVALGERLGLAQNPQLLNRPTG